MIRIVLIIFFFLFVSALEPSKVSLSVKNGRFGELLNLKLAEWRLDFDEDIYFPYNVPCPAGTCPYLPTSDPRSEAECPFALVPCDFTLNGTDCGKARYAVCESYCAAQRPTFCLPSQVWTTLYINEESEVFDIDIESDLQFFRLNWDRPCQGMRMDIFPMWGTPSIFMSPSLVDMDETTLCAFTSVPEFGIDICPFQEDCYRYSTLFFKVKSYMPYARYSVKISAFPIEEGPRRVAPPADAPPVIYGPLESYLPHIKLNFSVPVTLTFDPAPSATSTYYAFMLSTSYCGTISIQGGFNSRPGLYDDLAIFLSTYYDLPSFPPPLATMFPSDVLNGYVYFNGIVNRVQFCPPEGVEYGYLFMLVARLRHFELAATFTFGIDYDRPDMVAPFPPMKIGEYHANYSKYTAFPSPPGWYLQASSIFDLTCPNPSPGGGDPLTMSCRIGCNKFNCCENIWPSLPGNPSLDNFYPLPQKLGHAFDLPRIASYQYLAPLSARNFGIALLLDVNEPGNQYFGPLGADWEQFLPLCNVSSSLAAVSTLDGQWIRKSYSAPITPLACNYTDFLNIRDQLLDISIRFTDPAPTDSAYDLRSIRFRADSLLYSDAWQGCSRHINEEILAPGPIALNSLPTIACPVNVEDDPCCNPRLTDICCAPRSISLNGTLPSVIPDDLQCQQPECATRTLNRYVSQSILSEVGLCTAAPQDHPIYRYAGTMSTLEDCLHGVYGDERNGIACHSDADCSGRRDPRCDLLSHRCLGDLDDLNAAFTRCLADNLRNEVILAAAELKGWDLKETSFSERLLQTYGKDFCIQYEHGIQSSDYRSYYLLFSNYPGCLFPPDVRYLIHDGSTPSWATGRSANGALCSYFFPIVMAVVTPESCMLADQVCNWDPAITDQRACESPLSPPSGDNSSFCGFCESSTSCYAVPAVLSATACDAVGTVCVLNDDTIVTSMRSDADCRSTFRCNMPCPGGVPCATEAQCLQQGACSDPELIYPLLDVTPWAANHSRLGFCTFPMLPLNEPDCAAFFPGSYPTSFGCVVFGQCTMVGGFSLECVVDYDTPARCTSAMPGAKWFPRATDRATCEVSQGCSDPTIFGPFVTTTNDITLFQTPKNASECALCDGEISPVNTWTPAQWLGGSVRTVSWIKRGMARPFRYAPSLDFRDISRLLRLASDYSLGSQSLNTFQCFSSSPSKTMARILCDCLANGSTSECFSAQTVIPQGSGRICPGSDSQITLPPFTMFDFIMPNNTLRCASCTIARTSIEYFNPVPIQSVTIAFRAKDKQLVTGTFESVRNHNNAVVGQAVGDTVSLQFTKEDVALVERFTLCLTLVRGVQFLVDKYPVFDIGHSDFSTLHIMPLNVAVTFANDTGTLCGQVKLQGERSSYAPIIRMQDYMEKKGNEFTTSQRACMYAVAGLYSVAGIILSAYLIRLVAFGFHFTIPANLLWFLFGFIIVMRLVYLYLVPSGVLNQPNQDQLLDYWFMDFPICLYLCANLLIGVIFVFIRFGKTRKDDVQLWAIVGFGSFVIIMIFIGALLAFRYQVLDGPEVSGPLLCPVIHDSSPTARIIRLVYQSIILFISICIGLVELIFGYSLYHSSLGIHGAGRTLYLAGITCFGVISDSVAFLIYYIVDDPTPYFSIVLIFTEIIPIVVIMIRISEQQVKQNEGGRTPRCATVSTPPTRSSI